MTPGGRAVDAVVEECWCFSRERRLLIQFVVDTTEQHVVSLLAKQIVLFIAVHDCAPDLHRVGETSRRAIW